MTTVRELIARLGFKTDDAALARWDKRIAGARRNMKRAVAVGQGLGRTFKTVGVAAVGAAAGAGALVKGVADIGDQAAKDARKLGLTAEAVQEFSHAAKLSGSDVGTMKTGLQALARGLNDATTKGVGPASEAFEQLGVSLDDPRVQSNDLSEVMSLVADKFSIMPDGAQKTALAMKLFSRSGAELIPLLNQGSEGMAAMRQEARDLGLVMSNEAAAESENFNDDLERTTAMVRGLVQSVAVGLMPMIRKWMERLRRLIRTNDRLIRQGVAQWIDRIIRAGKQLAPIVATMMKFILKLTEVLGETADAMGGAENAILILLPALAAMKTATIAAAGPWGVLAAAIIAAIPALIKVGGHLGDVMSRMTGLSDFMDQLDERNGGKSQNKHRSTRTLIGKDTSGFNSGVFQTRVGETDEDTLRGWVADKGVRDEAKAIIRRELLRRTQVDRMKRQKAEEAAKESTTSSGRRGRRRRSRRSDEAGEFDEKGYQSALDAYRSMEMSVDEAKLRAQYTKKPANGKSLTALELLERDFGAGLGKAGKLSGVRPSLGTTINKITNTYEPKVQVEIKAEQRAGESTGDFAQRVSKLVSDELGQVFSRGYLHFKGGTSA